MFMIKMGKNVEKYLSWSKLSTDRLELNIIKINKCKIGKE